MTRNSFWLVSIPPLRAHAHTAADGLQTARVVTWRDARRRRTLRVAPRARPCTSFNGVAITRVGADDARLVELRRIDARCDGRYANGVGVNRGGQHRNRVLLCGEPGHRKGYVDRRVLNDNDRLRCWCCLCRVDSGVYGRCNDLRRPALCLRSSHAVCGSVNHRSWWAFYSRRHARRKPDGVRITVFYARWCGGRAGWLCCAFRRLFRNWYDGDFPGR